MRTMSFVELQYRYQDAIARAASCRGIVSDDWDNAMAEAGAFKAEIERRQRRVVRSQKLEEKFQWSKRKLKRTAS